MNIAEILQGHEGVRVYTLSHGELIFNRITDRGMIELKDESKNYFYFYPDGAFVKNTHCMIYPDFQLFREWGYESDTAWHTWHECHKYADSQTSDRPRVAKLGNYWVINDTGCVYCDVECESVSDRLRYEFGNYFETEEEAESVAALLRKTLQEYWESKSAARSASKINNHS